MAQDRSTSGPLNGLLGVGVLLGLALLVLVGMLARNAWRQYDYIGRPDQQLYTISISGEGKVTAIPDIAEVQLGIETQKPTVGAAQKENTDKMNQVIGQVKALGVEDKDIKTANYNIYPQYDYVNNQQVLRGYVVSQSVTVKIRNLDSVGAILELGGKNGVNQLGGLAFTIDEPESLRQQAREEALNNAKEKAEALAKSADVKLGRLVSFTESQGGTYPMPVYRDYAVSEKALDAGSAPDIQAGSQDIVIYVTVTYEVL